MSPISSTTKNKGITLIETILYVFILTLLMGVIVQLFIAIGGAYKNIKAARETEIAGTIAIDRVLREIRNASSVVVAQSSLGTNPGALTISGIDESLNDYTVSFAVSSGVLTASRDGGAAEALTPAGATVNFLVFNKLTNPNSEGVRVELEISNKKFYGFAALRGSY